MKLSISNIALPPYHHAAYFPTLIDLGIEGLEVATSRVWQHSLRDVTLHEVEIYRKQLEQAELEVVGLHSLLFGEKNCSLFDSPEHFSNIVAHFNKLISVCSHLGGHTMIFGAGRRRGLIPYERAYDVTRSFLDRILPDLEKNNITLCFEPLGPKDTDFLNTVSESMALVEDFNSVSLGVQIDVKALVQNREIDSLNLSKLRDHLVHVHVNANDLGVIGENEEEDHHKSIALILDRIEYSRFLSIEQIQVDSLDVMGPIEKSINFSNRIYRWKS